MITKTPTGVDFFDAQYGGVYRGRSMLVRGRASVGKTIMGLQFIRQGLQRDERCLILSTMQASDLTICSEAMGFSLTNDLDLGHLILLEYQKFMPGGEFFDHSLLPPEGFEQLREVIDANAIRRVVLDTIIPWVTIRSPEKMAEHVFSFVQAFDRLGTTTLMTLPKPASPMAIRLAAAIEDVVPVSILLSTTEAEGQFTWQVTKYLGEKKLFSPVHYSIEQGHGLTLWEPLLPLRSPGEPQVNLPHQPYPPAPVPNSVPFAPVMPGLGSPTGTPGPTGSSAPGSVRFSTVWAPPAKPS